MLSMTIPIVGPVLDILWAPYAAKKMTKMYKGKDGKIRSKVVLELTIYKFSILYYI